jgi:hypothetical protein
MTSEEDVRRATLIEAYWRLHDQAENDGSVYRTMWNQRYTESAPDSEDRRTAKEKLLWLDLQSSGIHSAACTIAVMLGVRAVDIERPDALIWQPLKAQDLATDEQIIAYWDDRYKDSILGRCLDEDGEARIRAQRIVDTRANPEQMRKVAEWQESRP